MGKKKYTKEQQQLLDRIKPLFLAMIHEPTLDTKGKPTKVNFMQRFTKCYIAGGNTFTPDKYGTRLYTEKTWDNPFGQVGLEFHEYMQMNQLYGMFLGFKCAFNNHPFVDKLIEECLLMQLHAQRKAEGLTFPPDEITT